MMKKPGRTTPSVWTFIEPFPGQLWLGIFGAIVVTSLAMFVIHKLGQCSDARDKDLKTNGTKNMSDKNDKAEHHYEPEHNFGTTQKDKSVEMRKNANVSKIDILECQVDNTEYHVPSMIPNPQKNEFSLLNSIWYTMAGFLQQGSASEPR